MWHGQVLVGSVNVTDSVRGDADEVLVACDNNVVRAGLWRVTKRGGFHRHHGAVPAVGSPHSAENEQVVMHRRVTSS